MKLLFNNKSLLYTLIILFIIILLIFIIRHLNKSNYGNSSSLKSIPKVIHKVYIQNSGNIPEFPLHPPKLNEAHDSWKVMNPDYILKYYSLNDCREYLKKHFEDSDFLQTFDCLNAYAFKCDFFRYCVLYIEGGWYSDWKQKCLKYNLLNELDNYKTSDIVLFEDLDANDNIYKTYIQNNFIGAIKNNLFLKESINEIINNVKYRYYFKQHPRGLMITGPGHLRKIYNTNNYKFKFSGYYTKNKLYVDRKCVITHKIDTLDINKDYNGNGNYYEHMWNNNKIFNKFTIKDKIPKIIHKTGPYKKNDMPSSINELFNDLNINNPDYKINYYDDNDCYNLIKNNFDSDVLLAYNKLKPTAYKADLFRYCVLYLYGGIYSDLSQKMLIQFDDIIDFERDTLILCKDRYISEVKNNCIQISFMCAIPKCIIFKKAIDNIVLNCKKYYYGPTPFSPTGPCLFLNVLNSTDINYIIKSKQINNNTISDYNTGVKIIDMYYKNHHKNLYKNNNLRYGYLWFTKNIYNINSTYDVKYVNNRSLSEICNIKPNKIISDTNYLSVKDYENIRSNDKIFVVGTTFEKFINILENINATNLIIIVSASDIGFPLEQSKQDNFNYLEYINSSKKIKFIYASNCDLNYISDKIFPIPLGIDYHTLNEKNFNWGPKNLPIYQEVELEDIYDNSEKFENRKNNIYSFFHLNIHVKNDREHTKDRNDAYKHLNSNSLNIYQKGKMNRTETWKEMIKYKWIASPHGNGLDCHRTYEAIALGCIPIVKTSVLDNLYKNMPIIICKDWSELTLDFLNTKTIDALKKSRDTILLDYWKLKINSK